MTRTESAERARLSREAVVDGALALAGEAGMDGLTIRRLAHQLGVTPMALYWHFKNKDELLVGMADRVWSLVDSGVDPALSWPEQLRALMRSLVGVLRAHPDVTPLLGSVGVTRTSSCLPITDAALSILHRAGYSPRQSADLCVHGLRTAVGLVAGERHTIAAAEPPSSRDDLDAYYEFGLELFIAGVIALVPHPSS